MGQMFDQAERSSRRAGLGLSFSGGGFRATAFSLGTLTLLQDLRLLERVKVMSSVSGGSLALAAYVCAKAGSDAQRESAFRFDDCFYRPLMAFLEGERLAKAFVDIKALLRGEKLILKAADATHEFLNELLNGGDDVSQQEAILGNEKITEMLANDHLSPDHIFINATNISSLDLFRFSIMRSQSKGHSSESSRPIFVLNRYLLRHNRDSAKGKTLYHYAQQLRLADCVAASFGFPAGFEPLLFPDDFFHLNQKINSTTKLGEAKNHFRGDLICDHKNYLAFLDGGLYDNLGLASVEDIRRFLHKLNEEEGGESQPIHYVIATDVDQIPTQYTHYTDENSERQLEKESARSNGSGRTNATLPLINGILVRLLVASPFVLFVLVGLLLAVIFAALFRPLIAFQTLLPVLFLIILVALFLVLKGSLSKEERIPRNRLSLSDSFSTTPLGSLLNVGSLTARKALVDPMGLWQVINTRRLGQLIPAFNGYLKRTRSLTYGYLQQAYQGLSADADCHLIRNMIFELAPGQEIDPDYAANLITLPIQDYRHEENLNPISPIARKIMHARYVSTLLRKLPMAMKAQAPRAWPPGVRVEELDLGEVGSWRVVDIEALEDSSSMPGPDDGEPDVPLILRLLIQRDGQLLEEARQIINELNLVEADEIWRWLCNNLACYEESSDSGCLPAHPGSISIPVSTIVADIHQVFKEQIRNIPQLLDRCLVSTEESTSSYSWIPFICEMATHVPTTLWLKDVRWYVPNQYDSHQRIVSNGQWFVEKPRAKDLKHQDLIPLDLSRLGPAPAAAICVVAGYLSTGFNLLEFFYSWLGNCEHARQRLLARLKQHPFPFETREELQELAELPYPLRHWAWEQLKAEERRETLAPHTLNKLPLLEYPLNRRNGMPDSFWAGRDGV
jgi:hypothetical protein